MIERAILSLALTFWLTACTLVEPSLTTSPAARPTPSLSPSQPTATAEVIDPTPLHQEPDEEKQIIATAAPTPTPAFPDLPDLTPSPGGWIAFETPEERLALISPDGSRRVPLIEEGTVESFAWSPDGRWLAFVINGQLALISLEDSRLIPLTEQDGQEVGPLTWSPDGHWLAFIVNRERSTGGQLTLVSIEDSRLIPLTRPGTTASWAGLTWSQDSSSLAYFCYTNPEKEIDRVPARSPLALHLFDLSTHQVVTLTTYSNDRPEDFASLCSQAFPFPFLPVEVGCFQSSSLQIWDTRAEEMVVELGVGSSYSCRYLWSPEGQGIVFLKVALEKEGIKMEGVQDPIIHPVSLAWWGVGDEASVVVLEGTKKQSYSSVRWLLDGRLEVKVTHWEKEKYHEPAQPEHVTYRFFYVNEEGELREAEGSNLPWWAAGGFREQLVATRLPQPRGRLSGWEVGPDGETVIFTWRWMVDEESKSAIYLWRGEGEPKRLTAGSYPQWQPKTPCPSP